LYNLEYCSYCRKVAREANRLGLDVEVIDVFRNSVARERLRAGTGRTRVPVLGIIDEQGEETFLPESDNIIDYLRQRAPRALSPPSASAEPSISDR
jgi:glutathione S-transferase